MYLLTISTKLILKYKKTSENMNPQVYGIEHIIYIIPSLMVAFLVCIFTIWVMAPIALSICVIIILIVELVRKKKRSSLNKRRNKWKSL